METSLSNMVDIFLAIYFTSVALFYTARILWLRQRRPSIALINHGRPWQRQWQAHTAFRIFRVLIWGVCVVRLAWVGLDQWIVFVAIDAEFRALGAVFLLLGFSVALVGHHTLGEQWRSGVHEQQCTALVTSGVYAVSRNPMFIGVRIALLGFLLALPSLLSVVSLITGWRMLALQAEVEEQHLTNQHGVDYLRYQTRVARWLWS